MWGNRIFDICNFGASFWDKSSWWIWRDQPGNDSALKHSRNRVYGKCPMAWGFWTSLEHVSVGDDIPNIWVWTIRTFTYIYLTLQKIHGRLMILIHTEFGWRNSGATECMMVPSWKRFQPSPMWGFSFLWGVSDGEVKNLGWGVLRYLDNRIELGFKGCRPCRRPRKKWQGSKAGRKTLRCVAPWGSRPFCYVHRCEIYLIGLNFHV